MRDLLRPLFAIVFLSGIAVTAVGCNTVTRLSEIGDEPKLSEITNPVSKPEYKPVSLPMPAPHMAEDNPSSLWRSGAKAFFKDIRAKEIGDILTVRLALDDSATLENSTSRGRDDGESVGVDNILGFETQLGKLLPKDYDNENLLKFASQHDTEGDGSIDRSEEIELTFAAIVTQVLPNGLLTIMGRQEIRVNYELRELMFTGVVRPQDIEADNSIPHDRIAEMRVAYGGRGMLSDLQQPRWGTQVWDTLFPF